MFFAEFFSNFCKILCVKKVFLLLAIVDFCLNMKSLSYFIIAFSVHSVFFGTLIFHILYIKFEIFSKL